MMNIRPIEEEDIEECVNIYNWYIRKTTCTLEAEPLSFDDFAQRVHEIQKRYPYIVIADENMVYGYAYLSEFNPRIGYIHTASVSIYLDVEYLGHWLGAPLMNALIKKAKEYGIKDIIALITDDNKGSISFHKKMGFVEKAHLEGVAEKFDQRLGVIYMQLKLN